MNKTKTPDRQVEPEHVIYPLRIAKTDYLLAKRMAKSLYGRTTASVMREAIQKHVNEWKKR